MKTLRLFVITILLLGIGILPVVVQAQGVTVTPYTRASFRAAPDASATRLARIPAGTALPALGRNADASWINVTYNGQNGWVASQLLNPDVNLNSLPITDGAAPVPVPPVAPPNPVDPVPPVPVAPGNVTATNRGNINVRSGPSTDNPSLGVLPAGSTVALTGISGEWVSFNFNGQIGWLAGWLLTITGDINTLPNQQAATQALENQRVQLRAQIPQICAGGPGAAGATAYTPGDGMVHPVIAISNSTLTAHPFNASLTGVTTPNPEDIQLVACVDDIQLSVIEVCPYNGPDITRFQYTATVRLYAAQTAQLVAVATVRGNPPRECRQSEPFSLVRLEGSRLTAVELLNWLLNFAFG